MREKGTNQTKENVAIPEEGVVLDSTLYHSNTAKKPRVRHKHVRRHEQRKPQPAAPVAARNRMDNCLQPSATITYCNVLAPKGENILLLALAAISMV